MKLIFKKLISVLTNWKLNFSWFCGAALLLEALVLYIQVLYTMVLPIRICPQVMRGKLEYNLYFSDNSHDICGDTIVLSAWCYVLKHAQGNKRTAHVTLRNLSLF